MSSLADAFPDGYWTRLPGPDNESLTLIDHINEAQPLTLHPSADVRDHGHITSMVQSPDGRMLATFSSLGTVRVWDCETWTQIQLLKDEEEKNIDEFYCGRFTENMDRIVVGGKLKDPLKWSEEDNDNHILPCPLKIFDVMTGKVTERLSGHEEEILCIKDVEFKGEQYFITTSQDGYIIKWKMGSDWSGLQEYTRMEDGETCMAFNVTFLPQCGNKYFLAACDGGVNLFDFELNQKLHTFPQLYSCYCDCVKIVEALDFPPPPRSWNEVLNGDGNKEMFAYAVTRGVEEVEVEGGVAGVNTVPNTVRLHKIVYPTTKDDEFRLEEVKRYQHAEYLSNSWLTKISSNGRYILAPTYDGAVVVFNMASGAVTAVLRDHDGMEVRDVVLGWRSKWIATCSDGESLYLSFGVFGV
ncbi:WD40-repeat-containing domain protein [Fimicolochytrium jonesii]|uniref:WD40-repeat-containing domain protein n=1 Tax=Fimicolochytrium jonesii TaxID=1396493 RepID=UPI0022FDD105|nr:WD40-repeat-containing domain protein [Fimicolochytrium jonesii]KAI8817526.1 WD40-repeat-containing domain protein [Fimicolochytrium jonesii]